MFIGYVIVAVMLSAALTMSATGKLRKDRRIIEGLVDKAKVPIAWLPRLAALLLLGAAGLLIGIAVPPIGIAAAAGLVLYFIGAVMTHLRAEDPNLAPPVVLGVLGAAALVLRLLSV